MLGFFVVQLPFSVCLVWFLLMLLKHKKSHSDRIMMFIMGFLSVFFLCGSGYIVPSPNYELLAIYDIIMEFTSLSVFPLIYMYIRSCYEETNERAYTYLLFLPALLIPTASTVITAIMGVANSSHLVYAIYRNLIVPDMLTDLERAFVIMTVRSYRLVFYLSIAITLIYVFSRLFVGKFKFRHIHVFLSGRKSSFVANVIGLFFVAFLLLWGACSLFASIFMNPASVWSSVWSLVTAVVLFFIGYISAIPPLPGGYMNMARLSHPFEVLDVSPQEYMSGIDSGPVAERLTGYDKIMDSFNDLMVKQEGFLDPNMTIDEISRRLNSNRTYVSKLVNIYHGMPFRDYLNKMRIDYSKRLMTDEPDAALDYISAKSGFQSSTQFIRKFKELEGLTPTAWKSSQLKK